MHFLGNEDLKHLAYSVDLAWKCGTAVCERLVVTSYSRRAAERGDVATFLSAAGERMPCLSAAHCVALKSWRGGRSLEKSRVERLYHRCGSSSVSATTVVWNVRDLECPLCPGSRLSRSGRQLRVCAVWNVTGSSSSLTDAFYHWTPCRLLCLPRGPASKWHNL